MVNTVIRWCMKNTFLMTLIILGVCAAGYWTVLRLPVDAIPDIGEKQVIVYADWEGRSPQDVDDQVTYPLTTSLTGTPGVKAIRSMSGFGFSMVFVIFEDSIDYYWARSRVLERMNVAQQRLPDGVTPVLGPDATALGQVYWYTVEGEGFDLAELRSIQDWYIRYQLQTVAGVSEVASIGGFVKQYQIDINPDRMRAHRVTMMEIVEAVGKSNIDVGAKVIEQNGVEYFIRGLGFIKSVEDLERIVIRQEEGTPLYLRSVATVQLGPDFRRGALDKGGVEAVGGVVLMRYGENPRQVVARVNEKIAQLEAGLPSKTLQDGRVSKVRLVPFYDRTTIVQETIDTLKEALFEEALIAGFVVLFFLLHLRSTATVLPTLPLALAGSFIAMYAFGIDSNIMSLAGLAIAIGDIADMGIIMTENIYRRIAGATPEERREKGYFGLVYEGATEVGGAIITAVTNTIVSFIPVFFLTDQEGKLFKPLAFTKTFAIGSSVVLAITVVPFLCYLLYRPVHWKHRTTLGIAAGVGTLAGFATHQVFMWGLGGAYDRGWLVAAAVGVGVALCVIRMAREKFMPLEQNPVSRVIARGYVPTLRWILDHKKTFLTVPVLILFLGLSVWLGIHRTLAPLEWGANLLARQPASPELKRLMYADPDADLIRPLLELDQLRWQRIRANDGSERTRLLWRRQDPAERDAESASGLTVLKEGRILPGLGREFMPPLDEGSLLYMPSLLPQGSLSQAVEVNSKQDLAIAGIPEVESVVGKIGRADSALDPAPIGMIESIVILKPESQWRTIKVERVFSDWPALVRTPLSWIWPQERRITKQEILSELQEKTAIPGVLPTWLQPIQTRLVMLQTGFRAMMGVKIYGSDLREIEKVGLQIEQLLREVPGATDIVADRIVGKPYIQIEIDRERIARYGVNVRDVQDVIEIALGGMNLMESVEGRERYPIRVRLARDFREDMDAIQRINVPSTSGAQVPLAQLADISTVLGPQEIKGERGLLVGYVTMNTRDRDEVSVVQDAEHVLQQALKDGRLTLPPGYYWEWSGQFENQVRATKRMQILVPITLGIMFVMLYLGFSRWWIAPIIFFGVLVSASGGFIMLALWGVNLSVAVWVGFLVLFGVVDDDGVIISTYLEGVFKDRTFSSVRDIREAVIEAGLKRIRPCLMTIATTVFGLMPIFWSTGRGSDVMQPMAIPSVGGMTVSLITLFIVPCVFCAVEEWKWKRAQRSGVLPHAGP
ncbi:MAG: efflux RND transporter permease subunit [Leptolyngbya sp. PLA3]|nr:MAG: efflux RND transporter permease subunit [Cyanobacteria bacterium CYA]MCE7968151.1 efflux RND transporter permease subunit [Leptolyngbya sp. PL-A3]